jgi:hypothetical protein
MTEREYRRLPRDSYSTIKDFLDSRRKYYRKHVQGESVQDEEDDASVTFGSLLDCLAFTPDQMEQRFITADYSVPTGQMLDFCNALWKRTRESTSEDGRLTREFASLAEEAYNDVAFDANGNQVAFKQKGMTLAKVIERFNVEGADYYDHLRNANGRVVIEAQDEANAETALRELKSNFATRDIMNAVTTETQSVHDQLMIMWEYRGLPMKSMLDRVIVDHQEKKIYPYDLKTAWSLDNWSTFNYLKFRLYIQLACYNAALLKWVEDMGYQDYEIMPMKFIVVDSAGQSNPLVYKTTQEHLTDAINGFRVKETGRFYTGLRQAVDDLKWHKQMGLWGISRENYDTRGVVDLNYNS